jgi:hypothetical protein
MTEQFMNTGAFCPYPRRAVAVIAVHGVADQKAHESARTMAKLLQNLDEADGQPVYEPFVEDSLRVNVRPFKLADAAGGRPDDKPDLEFSRRTLKDYEGEPADTVYETVRLESCRPQTGTAVHVYECYWADLSRFSGGVARFFGEIYQLLFHLTRIGVHTVRAAVASDPNARGWSAYLKSLRLTSAALTILMPVVQLLIAPYLLVTIALSLVNRLEPRTQRHFALALLLAAGWTLLSVVLRKWSKSVNWWGGRLTVWGIVGLLPVLLVLLSGWWRPEPQVLPVSVSWPEEAALAAAPSARPFNGAFPHLKFIATGAAVLGLGAILLLMRVYDRRRPGALVVCIVIAPLIIGPLLWGIWQSVNGPSHIVRSIFAWLLGENFRPPWPRGSLLVLHFVWAVVLVSFVSTGVSAAFVWLRNRKDRKARRAIWTATVTTVLPLFGFITLTPVLWAVLAMLTTSVLPQGLNISGMDAEKLARMAVTGDLPRFLFLLLAAAVAAAVIVLWGLLPVVWADVFPPKRRGRSGDDASRNLGAWLNLGYRALSIAGLLICGVMFLAAASLPVMVVANYFGWDVAPRWIADRSTAADYVFRLGSLLGAPAAGLLAFGNRLKGITGGFRGVLDVVLDVDNYLKTHPVKETPRARMFARMTSLLRYVCAYRSEKDPLQYDALVIIAHSHGTVITADLLRLLKAEVQRGGGDAKFEPELARLFIEEADAGHLPVYFFTMGSPLRQLYGLRFPHLYGWAHNESAKLPPEFLPPDIGELEPNPEDLGVKQWTNAFRSGDYVGRQLWRHDKCSYRFHYPQLLDEHGP